MRKRKTRVTVRTEWEAIPASSGEVLAYEEGRCAASPDIKRLALRRALIVGNRSAKLPDSGG